jgi:hypothetical protein
MRMSENRMRRRIFGPKREKVAGGWRRHSKELNLYAAPNIIKVIKSNRMRWTVGHVTRMDEMRNAYKILIGK